MIFLISIRYSMLRDCISFFFRRIYYEMLHFIETNFIAVIENHLMYNETERSLVVGSRKELENLVSTVRGLRLDPLKGRDRCIINIVH